MLPFVVRRRRSLEAEQRQSDQALGAVVADVAELKGKLAAARAAAARDRLLTEALRERFVVTKLDGTTFEGLLVDVDERCLVLVQAMSYTPQGTKIGVDGALYLERRELAYLQRPGGLPAPDGTGA